MGLEVIHGDALAEVARLPDASVDAIVTDPPYEIGFMGTGWDRTGIAYSVPLWRDCRRVLKPGGYLLAFGGTRTWHRLACAIEDAGFEIHDSIMSAGLAWNHGQGFPKGKAQLKPAWEPIVFARKRAPGQWLNIAGCRVEADWATDPNRRGWQGGNSQSVGATGNFGNTGERVAQPNAAGRWPPNVALSHAPECNGECVDGCPVAELDAQSGILTTAGSHGRGATNVGFTRGARGQEIHASYGDSGGASRFFPTFRYQAKAPTRERPRVNGISHPTVKPLALMRWLVRLVTPPGGTVLDPFAGTGTTGEACVLEGLSAVLIENDARYLPHIALRLQRVG